MSRPDPFEAWLERELSRLPLHRASTEFRDRVLAAHDQRSSLGWMAIGWRRAAVAAVALVLTLSLGLMLRERALQRARDLEKSSLRAEYRALEKELKEIRSLAAREAPLLRIGAGEDLELVLDASYLLDPAVAGERGWITRNDIREAVLPNETE